MNEGLDSSQSPNPLAPPKLVAPQLALPGKTWSHWIKRFVACNPFYLVSAALLLYSFYRVSVDPSFLSREVAQLAFNLTSLQFYEVLLVVTAIFLASRRIWYDSTLLVGMENLLVLVPFILITQAALIDTWLVWLLCLSGGLLVIARSAALKRYIPSLNLPGRVVSLGLAVLAVNVALPIIYRILHEYKVGTKPDWGAAYYANEFCWLLLLPALCALAFVVPHSRPAGETFPQRTWLAPGFFALWLVGTVVHMYCLGYVYDFSLRPELAVPAIWVLLWVCYQRMTVVLAGLNPAWRKAALVPPLVVTFFAMTEPNNKVFLVLTVLNLTIYGMNYFYHRDQPVILHLFLVSAGALIAGLPGDWGRSVLFEFSRVKAFSAGGAAYLLFVAALSRNPKFGLLGAIVSAVTIGAALGENPQAVHWALQVGLAFLLVHSLRWVDHHEAGAAGLRLLAACAWVTHSALWMHLGGAGWMTCVVAAPVLVAWLAALLLRGTWGPWLVPVAAGLVLLAGPSGFTAGRLQSMPFGLLAMTASFLLFGLGTVAALTKHRWLR